MDAIRGSSWGSGERSRRSRRWDDDDDFAPAFGSGSGRSEFKRGKLLSSGHGSSADKLADDALRATGDAAVDEQATKSADRGEASTGGIAIGDKVRHKSFGQGRVISFEGTGKSTVAKVVFDSGAEKRLMLRFAPLEKIE